MANQKSSLPSLLRSFPALQQQESAKHRAARQPRLGCTIIAKNYLPAARTLIRSIARTDPGLRWVVLVIEPLDGYIDPEKQPFEILQLSDLRIPDIHALCMRYTLTELATAVKPRLLKLLFERTGCDNLLYLDPDILVLNSLEPVYARLARSSILLTPHITRPVVDRATPSELTHLRCGLYNLGFLGVANTAAADGMLDWWEKHLFESCYFRPQQGVFVDQKWMDLVPLLFPDVGIVSDPGWNVAFWNLQERHIKLGTQMSANGEPLRFFHFSGYDAGQPDAISKFQDRFEMTKIGAVARLFSLYRTLLLEEGHAEASAWPYFYNSFDNGVPVTLFVRDLYDSIGLERRRFRNPFNTKQTGSFYAWMNAPVAGEGTEAPFISNALHYLWKTSGALQRQFTDILGNGRDAFLNWAATHVDPRIYPIALWRQTGSQQG